MAQGFSFSLPSCPCPKLLGCSSQPVGSLKFSKAQEAGPGSTLVTALWAVSVAEGQRH